MQIYVYQNGLLVLKQINPLSQKEETIFRIYKHSVKLKIHYMYIGIYIIIYVCIIYKHYFIDHKFINIIQV